MIIQYLMTASKSDVTNKVVLQFNSKALTSQLKVTYSIVIVKIFI